jgi:hypothetical protein
MRFPDYICIGVQKAGPTPRCEQLSSHHQSSCLKKELDFFFKPRGPAWYGAHFEDTDEQQICGDIR